MADLSGNCLFSGESCCRFGGFSLIGLRWWYDCREKEEWGFRVRNKACWACFECTCPPIYRLWVVSWPPTLLFGGLIVLLQPRMFLSQIRLMAISWGTSGKCCYAEFIFFVLVSGISDFHTSCGSFIAEALVYFLCFFSGLVAFVLIGIRVFGCCEAKLWFEILQLFKFSYSVSLCSGVWMS